MTNISKNNLSLWERPRVLPVNGIIEHSDATIFRIVNLGMFLSCFFSNNKELRKSICKCWQLIGIFSPRFVHLNLTIPNNEDTVCYGNNNNGENGIMFKVGFIRYTNLRGFELGFQNGGYLARATSLSKDWPNIKNRRK